MLGLLLVVSFWRCMKMERKDGQGKKHSPANAAVCVCISRRRCLHQQAASHCTNQSHELKRPSPGHQSPHRRRPIMARPGLLPGPRIDCRCTLCRGDRMRTRGCFALLLSVCLNLPLFVVGVGSGGARRGVQCLGGLDGKVGFNKTAIAVGCGVGGWVGDENILFPSGL